MRKIIEKRACQEIIWDKIFSRKKIGCIRTAVTDQNTANNTGQTLINHCRLTYYRCIVLEKDKLLLR